MKGTAILAASACCSVAAPALTAKLPTKPPPRPIIGQMLMVGAPISMEKAEEGLLHAVRDGLVAGVVLYPTKAQETSPPTAARAQLIEFINALQGVAQLPLFTAIDQEGGAIDPLAVAFGFEPQPSARQLGDDNDVELTRSVADKTAAALSSLGVNMVLAPIVDLDAEPFNPVIGNLNRSFGSNHKLTADHAAAFVESLARRRIVSVLKHFPGHGSSSADTHWGLTDVTFSWSEEELHPYRALLKNGSCCFAVMTGHLFNALLDANEPATLSEATIDGKLRRAFGFRGVVISDDLQMSSISTEYSRRESLKLAINAGVDVLLFSHLEHHDVEEVITTISDLVATGEIPPKRIWQAYRRIVSLKAWVVNHPSSRNLGMSYASSALHDSTCEARGRR